ncbi:MAG: hypothetical protein ACJ77A_08765 [Actinomycetota bacterium]
MKWKSRSRVALTALAIGAALSVLVVGPASARPPGITDVGKKLANFNIIAVPNEWSQDDSLCANNGARVFFRRGTTNWLVTWNFDPAVNGFDIVDCDGTTDGTAVIDQSAGQSVAIFVRIVGPQHSSLSLACTDVIDVNGVNSCLLGTYNLSKGKTFTKVTTHLFDTVFSQVLWTLQPSTNFRIAQVDVYALA